MVTTARASNRKATRGAALLLLLCVAISRLPGQEAGGQFVPEIISHSGSPLLLELSIPDPQGHVKAVTVESPVSHSSYQIPPDPDREAVQLTLSPFLAPGVYDLRVALQVDQEGELLQIESPARVGFVDFVFGRDNLRFGNNAEFTSLMGTFGEILAAWLDDRFEGISDVELVPLVDYMYQFFGRRSGRCYAFSGSEVRFWHWPELLPNYYDATYDLRAALVQTQREMNFLQIDMAFDHFLTGRHDLVQTPGEDPEGERREAILDEVWAIVSRISAGDPVVVGFIGSQLHHAMLVYGFIHRPESGTIDLLFANNWKSDQDLNLRSKNAEAVRVLLEQQGDSPTLEWWHSEGTRNYEIDRLFIVEVEREYEHDPDHLDRLIAARLGQLSDGHRAVLVVEDAAGAWLTNGEISTGYDRRRMHEEIDDVLFDRVNRTYRFEYPADSGLWLELVDDGGARILYFHPGEEPGMETAWIEETSAPAEGTTIRRRVSLETGDPIWQVVAEPDE
ncbi:MAG: hypothetical protein KOO61_06485 [Spirochaetales bacterium]|nr:hypothetical protein [Spirochaetales bacterium]